MARRAKDNPLPHDADGVPMPAPPADARDVVLHTRVVTNTGGGPDKTVLLSAPFLADTSYWLAAAYMHPPDDPGFEAVRARAARYGCPLIGVHDRGATDRKPLQQLLAICRQYNVRIWHGHDYKSNLFGLLLRPFWSMKLVTTVHGWVHHTARTPLYYTIDRWSLPFYHHVICVSEDLHQRVAGLNIPDERLTLIHNAIDERTFARRAPAAQSPMRKQRGVPESRLVFGAVGRLTPEKAFNLLIRAAASLIQQGVDLELWIAGEGEAHDELTRMIDRLGLADRIKLLGFVDDTIALYESLDAFVLSSLREGLPNVVLEAMAMSVPVVSTRVAGVPRLITDGQSGLLVPIGEVEPLAQAMLQLALEPSLRQRLAAAARAVIEADYSFTQRMAKVRNIYDRLLGKGTDEATNPLAIKPGQAPA